MRRTIIVSSAGTRLYQEQKLLCLEKDREVLERIPFEDIEVLVFDGQRVSVTSAVLASLAQYGSMLLVTGPKHHPAGLYAPVAANTLATRRLRTQIAVSDALKRNLWKRVIRAKIRAQAAQVSDMSLRRRLLHLASRVKSGDQNNHEAQAARLYWPSLFGTAFSRRREGPSPNNFLNYGYAVLRAAVARAICAAGLHPGLGIKHRNQYNTFVLADDLMEPFRPWIDQAAHRLVDDGESELTPQTKPKLVEVLYSEVKLRKQSTTLLPAVQAVAASLAKSYELAEKGEKAPEAARSLLLPKTIERAACSAE